MLLFNPSSTALVVDDHLIPAGEHGDAPDSPRVRELIDAGRLVGPDEPDEAAPPRKPGGK